LKLKACNHIYKEPHYQQLLLFNVLAGRKEGRKEGGKEGKKEGRDGGREGG
jgi:hypothetical protein